MSGGEPYAEEKAVRQDNKGRIILAGLRFSRFCSALPRLPAAKPPDARLAAAVLAVLLIPSASAQSGLIIETTVGGNVGDGGAATAAKFFEPHGMALDSAGNLYIADRNNQRIRKVSATGVVTTVAGTGTLGAGGDGGPATAAQLNRPEDVAVDSSGNLYIADTFNYRIRKVDSSGNISTVAGTGTSGFSGDGAAATAAKLNRPRGVALDAAGNLHIIDTYNSRIRKVNASGNISTVAGGGLTLGDGGLATAAKLNWPQDAALDGAGNLYIADRGNRRIRKVDVSTRNISTVAGSGTSGYGGDGGPATATAAKLNQPFSVAVDSSGNLYIADRLNQRIRKVSATGTITTVAGTGTAGYGGDGGAAAMAQLNDPRGVAVDGAGNVYIADTFNHLIRKVSAAGTIAAAAGTDNVGDGGAAAAAYLRWPFDTAVDGAGNLYIADGYNHRIRKVDAAGTITTVAGTGTAGYGGDAGPATAAQLKSPYGVAVDSSGNLYIADTSNNRIRKVDAAGTITTVAGTGGGGFGGDGGEATMARISFPNRVALDGAGNLYIADTYNNRIRKVDAAGMITTVAGRGGAGSTGDAGPAIAAQLNQPRGVAVDGAGNLYIADRSNHRIRKVDASTRDISTVAGTGVVGYGQDGVEATAGQLGYPYDVEVDSAGNLYIADTATHRVRKVDTAGIITTLAGTGTRGYSGDCAAPAAAQIDFPVGVAVDGAGNVYITDTYNHRIRKIGPAPGSASGPCAAAEPVPPTPEPAATTDTFSLSFEPASDADPSEPMSQTLALRAEGGAVDFQALPSARWIAVDLRSGSLAEGETITLRVTVNPLGLRPGTHRGMLYIRVGGRLTARVRIVLEVEPPTGPDVTESGGVLNAARMSAYGEAGPFGPPALPLTPGSLVVVQGVNFLAGEPIAAAGFPLPTSLGGARVLFAGLEAPLFSVGPRRIEAQLPAALGREALETGGTSVADVVVEAGGKSSYPRRFWVGPYGPGVFTVSGAGSGQAIVLFAGTTALAAPRGFGAGEGSRPARAGDVLEIYATGLGAVEPPIADGMNSCEPDGVCLADGSNVMLRHTAARPRVWIGGLPLAAENVRFSGPAPDMVGVNQVVVDIPPDLRPSDAAELRLTVAGRSSQSGVTIAVE